jgi:hypothetical protein
MAEGPAFLLGPGAGPPLFHPRTRAFARLIESIGPVEPFDHHLLLGERRGRPL